MTLDEMVDEVLRYLDDAGGNHWSTTEVCAYLNQTYRDFVRKTQIAPKKRGVLTSHTDDSVAADYALWTLPSDVYLIHNVQFDGIELHPADETMAYELYGRNWETHGGTPYYYLSEHYGDSGGCEIIRLLPYPTVNTGSGTVTYLRKPATLYGSDEPELSEMWHHDLVHGAVALAYLKDFDHRDPAKAMTFKGLFEEAVRKAGLDAGKRKIRSLRRQRHREAF